MELTQHGLLDELLALRRDTLSGFPTGFNEFFPNGWSFDSFDENPFLSTSNPSSSSLVGGFSNPHPPQPNFECPYNEEASYTYDVDSFTVPEFDSTPTTSLQIQEEYPSIMEDEELGLLTNDLGKKNTSSCKVEAEEAAATKLPVFNMGVSGERKKSVKKLEGQPSKNLMAERRRRKRLNDRLSMLRSIVPKISKMDRTSILGDTIDYMKELLEKINKLQEEEEIEHGKEEQMKLVGIFNNQTNPNEVLVRSSPKFEVERRNTDTRIEICCPTRPGLLLSTVNTLEVLGLEIQQCVISCFNDFSMQASCSEVFKASEQRKIMSSEEIKQAIFRNAGYGGRCL